ncbi:MAG: DUF1841 family protein [Burkholderiaceae bacterium]
MFAPSQADVRRFFCETYRKHREAAPLTPMEGLASHWIALHPEYHADLGSVEIALAAQFDMRTGRTNPFLHLSMHLTISEQLGIDQPHGIRSAFDALSQRLGSAHDAQHEVMECLGEMIWQSQRSGAPPDGERYIECVRHRATRV